MRTTANNGSRRDRADERRRPSLRVHDDDDRGLRVPPVTPATTACRRGRPSASPASPCHHNVPERWSPRPPPTIDGSHSPRFCEHAQARMASPDGPTTGATAGPPCPSVCSTADDDGLPVGRCRPPLALRRTPLGQSTTSTNAKRRPRPRPAPASGADEPRPASSPPPTPKGCRWVTARRSRCWRRFARTGSYAPSERGRHCRRFPEWVRPPSAGPQCDQRGCRGLPARASQPPVRLAARPAPRPAAPKRPVSATAPLPERPTPWSPVRRVSTSATATETGPRPQSVGSAPAPPTARPGPRLFAARVVVTSGAAAGGAAPALPVIRPRTATTGAPSAGHVLRCRKPSSASGESRWRSHLARGRPRDPVGPTCRRVAPTPRSAHTVRALSSGGRGSLPARGNRSRAPWARPSRERST
jgi:hypothetical protein